MSARKIPPPPTLEHYQERLRAAGLRSTAARVAVLRELDSASMPLSHADLVETLGDEGFDRVTLYRNLTDLTGAGMVMRTDLGDRVWRFELRHEGESQHAPHPHFTCTECGAVSCLPATSVHITPPKGAPKALSAPSVEIQLRGLCDGCA